VSLKVPLFLADHPLESLLAVCLLLGLLFLSADGNGNPLPGPRPLLTATAGR